MLPLPSLPSLLASERIEEARRGLAEAANQGIDQIEIHEILGEGAVRRSSLVSELHSSWEREQCVVPSHIFLCLRFSSNGPSSLLQIEFWPSNPWFSVRILQCSLERSTEAYGEAR